MRAFLSIRNEDKAEILPLAKNLLHLGFELRATRWTASFLVSHGVATQEINKAFEGSPHCVEAIRDGKFALVINTVSDIRAIQDSFSILRAALEKKASPQHHRRICARKKGSIELQPLTR